jgi:RNA polymerase sigma-70 factor, ECF subfamily
VTTAAAARDPEPTLEAPHAPPAGEWAALYVELEPMVRRLSQLYLGNPSDAEDVTQETFVRLAPRLSRLNGDARWYALRVARNLCCTELVRRRRARVAATRVASEARDETELALAQSESRELIHRVRRHLSRDEIVVFQCIADGLSQVEIAARLGCSEDAIAARLCRARKRLRLLFGAAGALVAVVIGVGRPLARLLRRAPAVRTRSGFGLATAPGVVLSAFVIGGVALGVLNLHPGPSHASGPAPLRGAGIFAPNGQPLRGASAGTAASSSGPADTRTGPAGRTVSAAGLVGGLVDPQAGATTGNTGFTSITPSPSYPSDHTIFASGSTTDGCANPALCYVLFDSSDGGATWTRLPAKNFAGGTILLPPSYPRDASIFAIGTLGLQRSDDRGRSFATVLPVSAPAAVSPLSTPGDTRILVGSDPLLLYDGATGTVAAGPQLPAGTGAPDAVAFAGSSGSLFVTAEALDPAGTATGSTTAQVVRCATTGCAVVAAVPGADALRLAVSRSFDVDGTVFAYAGNHLLVSRDRGATFAAEQTPAAREVELLALSSALAADSVAMGVFRSSPTTRAMSLVVSRNAGSSFTTVQSQGLSPDLGVTALVMLPDGHVLASVTDASAAQLFGLRCSKDLGLIWSPAC